MVEFLYIDFGCYYNFIIKYGIIYISFCNISGLCFLISFFFFYNIIVIDS